MCMHLLTHSVSQNKSLIAVNTRPQHFLITIALPILTDIPISLTILLIKNIKLLNKGCLFCVGFGKMELRDIR